MQVKLQKFVAGVLAVILSVLVVQQPAQASSSSSCSEMLRYYNSLPGGRGILKKVPTCRARTAETMTAVADWAPKFGVPVGRAMGIAACESYLDYLNGSGRRHQGVYQQDTKEFKRRLKDFNRRSGYRVRGGVRSLEANVAVSLWMMTDPAYGYGHWECKSATKIVQI
jgi:hypothetical protein